MPKGKQEVARIWGIKGEENTTNKIKQKWGLCN